MNDVLQVLLDMRQGAVAADVSKKFDEVVQAVIETGGKGELTLKLSVKPSKMGMGGCVIEVETSHECKLRKPQLDIGKSTFFVSREGKLTRDDPNQTSMFETKETKNVGKPQ
jgi:hypothetical protein